MTCSYEAASYYIHLSTSKPSNVFAGSILISASTFSVQKLITLPFPNHSGTSLDSSYAYIRSLKSSRSTSWNCDNTRVCLHDFSEDSACHVSRDVYRLRWRARTGSTGFPMVYPCEFTMQAHSCANTLADRVSQVHCSQLFHASEAWDLFTSYFNALNSVWHSLSYQIRWNPCLTRWSGWQRYFWVHLVQLVYSLLMATAYPQVLQAINEETLLRQSNSIHTAFLSMTREYSLWVENSTIGDYPYRNCGQTFYRKWRCILSSFKISALLVNWNVSSRLRVLIRYRFMSIGDSWRESEVAWIGITSGPSNYFTRLPNAKGCM